MGTEAYFENNELQLGYVVGVDPVLRCLADKVLLAATCSAVPSDWMSSGTHQII